MNNFQSILKEIQKTLHCPICNRNYRLEEIKLRGFFDQIFIFQTICINNHQPVSAILIVTPQKEPGNLKTNASYQPISSKEEEEFKKALRNFNGDFRAIFR